VGGVGGEGPKEISMIYPNMTPCRIRNGYTVCLYVCVNLLHVSNRLIA